jgi:hypothetical protein
MIRKFLNAFFPDIEKLSEKESPVSTKRYADLRIINHFVAQSWIILAFFIYTGHWQEMRFHIVILGIFAFARGVLATEKFKNFIKDDKNSN